MRVKLLVLLVTASVLFISGISSAEIIRGIDIEFVTIGNPGNPGDTRAEANPSGCGAVNYIYQIGKYEVTNEQWNAFVSTAGVPIGSDGGYRHNSKYTGLQQPSNNITWYEAAQFCNFLTSGDKTQGAYKFSGDNSNPAYFEGIDRDSAISTFGVVYLIPTEDEWYKAAYYKPDGNGYSTYANGLNTIPPPDNGWNYLGGLYENPWDVGTGTMEQNGTYDIMGNIFEWIEEPWNEFRQIRGGTVHSNATLGSDSHKTGYPPYADLQFVGLRVVAIPEPCSLVLLGLGGLVIFRGRR